MKKNIFFLLCLLAQLSVTAQAGRNCFNTQFNKDAGNYDPKNAYLMAYLATMVYADNLRYLYSPVYADKSAFIKSIRDDNEKYVKEYAARLTHLFTDQLSYTPLINAATTQAKVNAGLEAKQPSVLANQKQVQAPVNEVAVSFDFFHKCNPNGYDPEAILISTPEVLYVIFRGTDRVSCNEAPSGYDWAEWVSSDFRFLRRSATALHPSIKGEVHRGMTESLLEQNFAGELGAAVKAAVKNKVTGAIKKVWMSGHSLGGAHAQLFAAFLRYQFQVPVQGLYLYDSPHPGDLAFTAQLNKDVGQTRIQRFEFGDDPIPTLPPKKMLYGRAGVRNYYKDYNSARMVTEQNEFDDFRLLCAIPNLVRNMVSVFEGTEFPQICPGSLCFHHPSFLLKALRHQLSIPNQSFLPADVPLPVPGESCNQGAITKAGDNNLLNNTATAVENALARIVFQASSVAGNLTGSVPDGEYRLVCYAYKDQDRKFLRWNGSTNSQLQVASTSTVFTLKHKPTGGYQLHTSSTNMAADVKFTAGVPTGEENSPRVIMKSKDIIIGDEETWYLFKIPNTSNTYVFYNWNTRKVLEAPSNCLTQANCGVEESASRNDAATQAWILQKVQ